MEKIFMRVTTQEQFFKLGQMKSLEHETNVVNFCRINVSFSHLYPQIKWCFDYLNLIYGKLTKTREMYNKLSGEINKLLNNFEKYIVNVPTFNFRYSKNSGKNREKIIKKIKKFLKLLNNIDVDTNIGINKYIFELNHFFFKNIISVLKNDYVHFTFNIKRYVYNFSSSKKNECNLLSYHDMSQGSNCQFIGFFGPNMNLEQFKYFVDGKKNPLFVFYRTVNDKIIKIDNRSKYNGIFSKAEKEKFYQLLYAEQRVKIIEVDPRGETTQSEGGIQETSPLLDEYVLISNDDLFIDTIEIIECEYLEYEYSKADIMYNYLKMINGQPYDYIVTIDILEKREADSRKIKYREKYIKYKTKYLELKFTQTNFYNDK